MKKYFTPFKSIIAVIFISFVFYNCASTTAKHTIFIRANQVGFLPNDLKTAVVFSEYPVPVNKFYIRNEKGNRSVFEGTISDTIKSYDKFKYCYELDFSNVTSPGTYRIDVDNNLSHPFKIGTKIYNNVVDSLMLFLKNKDAGQLTRFYTHPVIYLML